MALAPSPATAQPEELELEQVCGWCERERFAAGSRIKGWRSCPPCAIRSASPLTRASAPRQQLAEEQLDLGDVRLNFG